jgi:hypothetical protein
MTEREKYVEQLKAENRALRQEMYEEKPYSAAWQALRREITANNEEIAIMEDTLITYEKELM